MPIVNTRITTIPRPRRRISLFARRCAFLQFALFVALLTAVILEHGSTTVSPTVLNILTVAALTPAALAVLLSVQTAFNECGIHPLGVVWRPIERACMRVLTSSPKTQAPREAPDLKVAVSLPDPSKALPGSDRRPVRV